MIACKLLIKHNNAMTTMPIKLILIFILSTSVHGGELNKIIMKKNIEGMKKANVGHVVYPHKLHENIYKCIDCHPSIFVEKIGANNITMQKNIEEKFCGSAGCHNSAYAFPLYLCDNCHAKIQK